MSADSPVGTADPGTEELGTKRNGNSGAPTATEGPTGGVPQHTEQPRTEMLPSASIDAIKPWYHFWSAKAGRPALPNKRVENIRRASDSLLGSFTILFLMFIGLYVVLRTQDMQVTLAIVLLFGALGSFLAQQRRLRQLSDEDLELFISSAIYRWLSPIAGATLAGILYLIFIGDLLGGELFPEFELPPKKGENTSQAGGINIIFEVGSAQPAVYAKLLFWSFVAGYSERFVTDIIGRFESQVESKNPMAAK
ncbi:MAG: hypothetical protein AB7G68_11010 [Nitrospiraceae bacterium]